jgi:hypothetical protein
VCMCFGCNVSGVCRSPDITSGGCEASACGVDGIIDRQYGALLYYHTTILRGYVLCAVGRGRATLFAAGRVSKPQLKDGASQQFHHQQSRTPISMAFAAYALTDASHAYLACRLGCLASVPLAQSAEHGGPAGAAELSLPSLVELRSCRGCCRVF